MADATLRQGTHLMQMILKANDPGEFAQNLHRNWGAVQKIGNGEVDQATFMAALEMYFKSDRALYGWFGQHPSPNNPWTDKHLKPRLFYPPNYQVNSVEKEVDNAYAGFAGIPLDTTGLDAAITALGPAPQGADGPYPYIAIRRSKLASIAGIDQFGPENFGLVLELTTHAALQRLHGTKYKNWPQGKLGSEYFRIAAATWEAQTEHEAQFPEGDFVPYWGQSGRLGAGNSPRFCGWEIDHADPSQWRWSSWEGTMCVITNPHRLEKDDHLVIDLPGDELSPDAGGGFDCCSFLDFSDGQLHFDVRWAGFPSDSCGSGSAFARAA